jgi:hypothetical protein
MSCVNRLTLTALFTLAASATSSLAGQATTTRIEPRPFYGATVTLEEGVRVFRPLPVTRHVVINPGNKASVSVNYNEERTYNYSRSDNYDHSSGGNGGQGGYGGSGYYGGFPIGTPAKLDGRGAPGGVFGPIKRKGKGGGKSH